MDIRQAKLEDIEKISEIVQVLQLDIPEFVWTSREYVKKQVEKGEYFFGCEDGVPVGALSLRERNGILYIETLAVAKDAQLRGIGSKLVDFAKEFAKKKGFKKMRTTSFYEYGVKDYWLKQDFRLLEEPEEYGGHEFYRFELDLSTV